MLSKASDHADAMDLLCPINPLATRVPINDNDMLTKAFKLSLARKQFSVSLTSRPPLDSSNQYSARHICARCLRVD